MKELTLTQAEQARLQILNQVLRREMAAGEAASLLGLSERHIWRLLVAYRKEGAASLAHGNRPPHVVGFDPYCPAARATSARRPPVPHRNIPGDIAVIGEISAVASSMTWAGSTVVVKTISGTVRPIPISAVQTCVSAAALFVLAAAFGRLDDLVTMPAYAAGMLVASSVTNTLGIIAFLSAISLGAVGWTFVMTNGIFIPTSVVAGWLLLGDEITAWTWVGGGTILAGLYLLNRRGRARGTSLAPGSTLSHIA